MAVRLADHWEQDSGGWFNATPSLPDPAAVDSLGFFAGLVEISIVKILRLKVRAKSLLNLTVKSK